MIVTRVTAGSGSVAIVEAVVLYERIQADCVVVDAATGALWVNAVTGALWANAVTDALWINAVTGALWWTRYQVRTIL